MATAIFTPPLMDELSRMIRDSIVSFLDAYRKKREERQLLELIHKINVSKADVETFRDILEDIPSRSILDAEAWADEMIEQIEDAKEKIEEISGGVSLPSPLGGAYLKATEELYSSLVNASFDLSMKIAEGYRDSQSAVQLLQEA